MSTHNKFILHLTRQALWDKMTDLSFCVEWPEIIKCWSRIFNISNRVEPQFNAAGQQIEFIYCMEMHVLDCMQSCSHALDLAYVS